MNAPRADLPGLDISAHETVITLPDGATLTLPIGAATLWVPTAAGPTALALENGIQTVEDAIERVVAQVPSGASMLLSERSWAPLQRGGAVEALVEGTLGVADIEREYQWLAARAIGAPSARGSGFEDPSGDAIVLILRECMHHLRVDALHIVA